MLKTRPAQIALLICLLCIVTLIAVTVVRAIEDSGFHRILVHEAGEPLPPASMFIKSANGTADYVTDPAGIDTSRPGIAELQIQFRGRTVDVMLDIRDTRPPVAQPVALDLKPGETAEPAEFITSILDATPVEVRFGLPPDFSKINTQSVTLILTDAAGNSHTYVSTVRISVLASSLTVEAGASEAGPDPRMLLKDGVAAGNVSWTGNVPDLTRPGSHPAAVIVDGRIFESEVVVVDTVAPAGTAVNLDGWVGDEITAAQLVGNIIDATAVQVTFETNPDLTREGNQQVRLLLTDAAGNQTRLAADLTLVRDTEPPVIYGSMKYTFYIGQPALYRRDFIAIDNRDGEIEISVDSGGVNPRVPGDYVAVYTAADAAGNVARADVAVTVKNRTVTMEELYLLADEILDRITTEDMSLYYKAWEIYQYVNLHLTYTGTSDKTDWMFEARRGIVQGVGDCFTYYSMSHLLLNRIGMQTLSIERANKPGEARHYWHMVNWGEGWYHFDACIHIPKLESFMLTTAQVDAYSARVGRDNYYYRFNRDMYPASATVIVNDINVPGPR